MKQFTISSAERDLRLDQYLIRLLPGAGKSFLYKMLRKKNITLNAKKAEGNERLKEGDEIRIFFSDETYEQFHRQGSPKQQNTFKQGIPIIYEDEDILIADKPAGLLSQKAKPEDYSLNDWFLAYIAKYDSKKDTLAFTPSIANRLDRNTSGMILCGKTLSGSRYLSAVLRERSLHKYYLALVHGYVGQEQKISGYLKKDSKTNQVIILKSGTADSSYIETSYRPLCYCKEQDITLLEVLLVTGKTHQIRAHLASCAHPLVCDPKYGDTLKNKKFIDKYGIKRQLLHCYKLTFPSDSGHSLKAGGQTFFCPPPKDFIQITGDIYGNLEFSRS